MTPARSLALNENHTERDAQVPRRLREAGLLFAGKTKLPGWGNFRNDQSSRHGISLADKYLWNLAGSAVSNN
jgi:Asp-tRNA(Asn)/Glu-tRNA(Gln) amidotransferase A subunit family amidase